MLEKYSPGKDFALVAINWDPHQTSRHTPVSTRWKKQHIQREELKYYSRRNFEDTLNQSPWRSDEKTKVLQMKWDQNLGLLTLRDTALPQYAMLSFSWIQWNQELCFIEKAELGRTHLYVNSCPLIPVPCDFPGWSSFLFSHLPNPVIITFFSLKCCDACEHSPAGTSEFRTKSLLNRKGDRGNIASSCGEILWHFSQVCGCILWNFYESTSFQFSYSFYGGPVPIIFL